MATPPQQEVGPLVKATRQTLEHLGFTFYDEETDVLNNRELYVCPPHWKCDSCRAADRPCLISPLKIVRNKEHGFVWARVACRPCAKPDKKCSHHNFSHKYALDLDASLPADRLKLVFPETRGRRSDVVDLLQNGGDSATSLGKRTRPEDADELDNCRSGIPTEASRSTQGSPSLPVAGPVPVPVPDSASGSLEIKKPLEVKKERTEIEYICVSDSDDDAKDHKATVPPPYAPKGSAAQADIEPIEDVDSRHGGHLAMGSAEDIIKGTLARGPTQAAHFEDQGIGQSTHDIRDPHQTSFHIPGVVSSPTSAPGAPTPHDPGTPAPELSSVDMRSLLAADGVILPSIFHTYCLLLSMADAGVAPVPPSTLTLQGGGATWETRPSPKFDATHTLIHPVQVNGYWWVMVLWPFFDEYLLYGPSGSQGPTQVTIKTEIISKTIALFQQHGPDNTYMPSTGEFIDGNCDAATAGILCLVLAHVAAESRVPIKGFSLKTDPTIIRKRLLSEIMRRKLEGGFEQYAVGVLRY